MQGIVKGIKSPLPFMSMTSVPAYVKENMYETLVSYDREANIHPWLAESWTPNADSSVWTFQIRKGVKFHDGTELTAADVVWSLNHILNPENTASGHGQIGPNIKEIVATGEYTVQITAPGPRGLMPEILAKTSVHVVPADSMTIGQRELVDGAPPPGSGPFKFKSWTPGEKLEVVRFDDYWGGAAYLDGVNFIVISNKASRAAAIQAGDIQLTGRLGPTFVDRITSGELKGLNFTPIGAAGLRQLVMNTKLAPTSNVLVRKAIALSLDAQAILDETTFGYGVAVSTWDFPGGDWGKASGFQWERNVDEAKRLLSEAGYSGEPITLGGTQGQSEEYLEVIARQAKEAGINFTIQNIAGSELIAKTINDELHVSLYGGGGVGEPLVANIQYISCIDGEHAVNNVSNYCSPGLEAGVSAYLEESDRDARLAIWTGVVQEVLEEQVAYIVIGWPNTRNYVWRDEVKNWQRGPGQEYWHAKGGLWRTWLDN
jgi:peptide/nickel transport system substrate-binding protein